jgi:dihydroneopterin triphosphate diphosphatase
VPPSTKSLKRPESVLVVVYTLTGRVLLLRRTGRYECRDKQDAASDRRTGRYEPPPGTQTPLCRERQETDYDRRCDQPGFWQSVTGSMEWEESSPRDTAARELQEETGLMTSNPLRDLGITFRYPVMPAWRSRYSPNVTENLEHVFAFELPQESDLTIRRAEHSEYGWFPFDEALDKVASWTNREAILAVLRLLR